MTFGGTALAVVSGGTVETCTGGDRVRVEIWELEGASGTGDIVVTLSGTAHHSAGAINFHGVDQTTPIADVATAVGQSPSAAVTSETGGAGRDAVVQRTNATISADTGQTERYIVATIKHFGGGSTEPGAASVTMGWTTNATCSTLVVIAVAPAP